MPVTPALKVHDVFSLARRDVGVVEHEPVVPFLPHPPHVVPCTSVVLEAEGREGNTDRQSGRTHSEIFQIHPEIF